LVLKCVQTRAVILGLGEPAKGDAVPIEVRLVRADDFYSNAERLPFQERLDTPGADALEEV
jgi:hypothetical protein